MIFLGYTAYIILIAMLVALLGFPTGYFVSNACKEELKPGRKYFVIIKWILLVLMVLAFIFYLLSPSKDALAVLLSLIFILGLPTGALIALKGLKPGKNKK